MNDITTTELCEDIGRLTRWLKADFGQYQSTVLFGPDDESHSAFLRSLKVRLVQIVACLVDEDPSKTEAQLHKCRNR